jgi:hypothetical protein
MIFKGGVVAEWLDQHRTVVADVSHGVAHAPQFPWVGLIWTSIHIVKYMFGTEAFIARNMSCPVGQQDLLVVENFLLKVS